MNGLLSTISPFDIGTPQESVLSTTLLNLVINDTVNGINLPVKSLVLKLKYLGLLFDQKLTWQAHIRELIKACHKGLGLLKTLASHQWGARLICFYVFIEV